jgi:hypothetical protein
LFLYAKSGRFGHFSRTGTGPTTQSGTRAATDRGAGRSVRHNG